MKILIKAPPLTGKSTLIKNFINQYNKPKLGFVASRMIDRNYRNQGFKVSTVDGRSEILAHRGLIQSEVIVGNGHRVNLDVIENFISAELEKSLDKPELVIFDEIGRMQSFSERFINTARSLFNSKTDFLATIVYDDEPWSMEFKTHPEVIVIELTLANREFILEILLAAFGNATHYNNLKQEEKELIKTNLHLFLDRNMFIQAKKLFTNF